MMYQWCLLCFLALALQPCEPSNILILSITTSHSHSLWCSKMAELLAIREHQVTIIDTDPPRKKLSNLTTIVLDGTYEQFKDYDYQENSLKTSPKHAIDDLFEYEHYSCRRVFFSPSFKKFVDEYSTKNMPFDLIIADMTVCECFLGLVPLLGYPKLIFVSPFGDPTNILYIMRNQQNFIHNPHHLTPYSHPMTFSEKMGNLFYSLYYQYKYAQHIGSMDNLAKEYFGSSTPPVLDVARRSLLALLNSHPPLDNAKYTSPTIINIGGFLAEDSKKLDEKTQEFLDGAKDGAILFTLGSNFYSSYMSKEKINIFLNVFKGLKQRVLWKFESDLSGVPKNVMVSKWVAQNDVLGHPNVKVFIYHMGLLGTQEAIYHGVPVIGIPLMFDQHVIMQRLCKNNVALHLRYAELNENVLKQTIEEALFNQSYAVAMKKWSTIYRDRAMNPRELAVYWIEYALRHDDMEFLQPPEAYVEPLQLFLLDTKTIFCTCVGIIVFLLTRCYSCIFCQKTEKLKTH